MGAPVYREGSYSRLGAGKPVIQSGHWRLTEQIWQFILQELRKTGLSSYLVGDTLAAISGKVWILNSLFKKNIEEKR